MRKERAASLFRENTCWEAVYQFPEKWGEIHFELSILILFRNLFIS